MLGAAAAVVGIVVGVVTLSGAGFRVSFMVTQGAQQLGSTLAAATAFLPFQLLTLEAVTLFLTLVFVAVACILMGAGIPTTALYIILVSVAAPALVGQGIPPFAAHLFVLYYGVLADITPPVCTAAYAAGGIAGANPFRTGITAFRLGNAKVMVPFVFIYSPAMLIVLPEYFTWAEFLVTTLTCALGVMALGAALTGYLLREIPLPTRLLLAVAAGLMVAPEDTSNLVGSAIVLPVIGVEYLLVRRSERRGIPAARLADDEFAGE